MASSFIDGADFVGGGDEGAYLCHGYDGSLGVSQYGEDLSQLGE